MRLWPRSIAGRATLVLIGGVLAVLWAGAMVWWLSISQTGGPPGSRIAFESVAGIAAIVDRLPPELRVASLASATDHLDHVLTQLPYALLAAAAALVLFLGVGFVL